MFLVGRLFALLHTRINRPPFFSSSYATISTGSKSFSIVVIKETFRFYASLRHGDHRLTIVRGYPLPHVRWCAQYILVIIRRRVLIFPLLVVSLLTPLLGGLCVCDPSPCLKNTVYVESVLALVQYNLRPSGQFLHSGRNHLYHIYMLQ